MSVATTKIELRRRVEELNVKHPMYQDFYDMLTGLRPDPSLGSYRHDPQHLFIVGESGVGKSRIVKRYAEDNPPFTQIEEDGTEIDVKPVVYVELPDPFTMVEFYQHIVRALGAPQYAGIRVGDVKRQALSLLSELKTEILILDEVNYVMGSRYVKKTEAMEAFKHISNQANVSVVLVGTPETKELTRLSFQYFRRFPRVELRRFDKCDELFCSLLTSIENQIGPPVSLGIGNYETGLPQVLYAMCGGLLGALTSILRSTYRKMLEQYTLDDLGDAEKFLEMLSVGQQRILGDNEAEFMAMLEKSEKNNSDTTTF
ncbi:TniB family NTP-binding protein [Alicyclobacillus tolerans]|uniref:TniB family NTP-binding protein n=1 Tax=Alicyclobacillus tolerans TaxID=90970 RepID=UPI001F3E53EB|nr:TniB family NTP-binding protein [Alicyclobacillus tolerans]MCF8565961.1 TniB family NTP-binding protein [Alicyclobacillus tolerans]